MIPVIAALSATEIFQQVAFDCKKTVVKLISAFFVAHVPTATYHVAPGDKLPHAPNPSSILP